MPALATKRRPKSTAPPPPMHPDFRPSNNCEQLRTVKEALHMRGAECCFGVLQRLRRAPEGWESLHIWLSPNRQILIDGENQGAFASLGHTVLVFNVLSVNCTSLSNTPDIFTKILGLSKEPGKKATGTLLQKLQHILIVAGELDYLITKDRAVFHDLFMLTTFPFSRCILIGVANAFDLADRFLPRFTSLNCKPNVVTFRAYSKDQIRRILEERLKELPHTVSHDPIIKH
ncbi:AAA ATPase [Orobanche gracilis]